MIRKKRPNGIVARTKREAAQNFENPVLRRTCTAMKVWNGIKYKPNWKKRPRKWYLNRNGKTGGEPDVVGYDKQSSEYIFTIVRRRAKITRSVCYDRKRWNRGKINQKKTALLVWRSKMGINLLTEEQYRELQNSGSSIRKHPVGLKRQRISGRSEGDLWDWRYGRVFITTTAQNLTMLPSSGLTGRINFTGVTDCTCSSKPFRRRC